MDLSSGRKLSIHTVSSFMVKTEESAKKLVIEEFMCSAGWNDQVTSQYYFSKVNSKAGV